MAVSASQVQQSLQALLPKNIEETRVVPVMEHRGAEGQEWIYDPEWGTYRDIWVPVKSFTGEYFSPSLNRNLTPEETRFVRPIQGQVADLSGDGGGYRTEDVGSFFVGEKLSKFLNDIGAPAEYIYGQQLPNGGFTFNPMNALPTDVGGRTNFAVNYGTSGEPYIQTYQSGTLFGSEKVDKIVDQLAKAANAALLTYVSGQALGAIGGDLLGAAAGDPTKAALYSNAGYGEGLLNMAPPPVITEPVLVPGDSVLSSTLAQPPLAVENIAGQLTPEAQALLGGAGVAAGTAASDLAAIEASMGTPAVDATGSATKAALYGDAGYGPGLVQGEAPIMESTPTSMGPGKEVSGLQVAKDIVTSLPGASKQYLTTALITLGLNPDLVNNIVGWKPSTTASTTTQTGGGSNFLGPIIGGLLSRQQAGSPAAPVTAGRAVDITSPIQSLLAPKLVQQRPVTLL